MRAGLVRGSPSIDAAFAAVELASRDKVRPVVAAPTTLLELARDTLVEDAVRPEFERWVASLYTPVSKRVGWQDAPTKPSTGEDAILRRNVVEILTTIARDPAARTEAARRGRAFLGIGSDGKIHREAAPHEIVPIILRVAIDEDKNGVAFDAALAHLKASDDAQLRTDLLDALADVSDDKLAERARGLILEPGVLRDNDLWRTLQKLGRARSQREKTWRWFGAHADAIADRLPAGARGRLPHLASELCDTSKIPEVKALFEPRLAKLVGAPRNLAAAIERIEICHAVRLAQTPKVAGFFKRPSTSGAGRRP
jgi:alanyl aminopeptidase